MRPSAEDLQQLLDAEGGPQPGNAATDAYLKADTLEGQRDSVITDYMLRILGLDVSLERTCWMLLLVPHVLHATRLQPQAHDQCSLA